VTPGEVSTNGFTLNEQPSKFLFDRRNSNGFSPTEQTLLIHLLFASDFFTMKRRSEMSPKLVVMGLAIYSSDMVEKSSKKCIFNALSGSKDNLL